MKPFIFLMCCATVASAQTQSLDTNADTTTVATNPVSQTIVGYQTGVQDGNSRVWQKIVQITDNQGNVTYQTNNVYNELATGLNHLVNGQWVESKEEIDILPDGTAAATNGQHQAYFPGDIYSGQIELVTPDGKQLYSRPVGLSYFDGTNSVLIAELTNSTGQVVGNNQVIYTNAFTDFGADIRYTYTKAGFEQDIILREQPPSPTTFGLNPDTTRLQVLTEFFDPPQPTVSAATVPTDAGDLEDDFLDFGVMQMIPGKAFLLGTTTPSVGVDKQWLLLDGRQMLVEEVPVVSIAAELENLPLPQTTSTQTNSPLNVVSSKRLLPTQRLATVPNKHPMQLAQAAPSSHGLVLDYVTMTSQTNYTFQGDTTYYISGTVNLYQTNTFEGGAVLKYTNNASVNLESGTVLNWKAAAYRPVIFTAKDDNSVGNAISGSTGSPTNYYANPALNFLYYTPPISVSYFRIAYASQAISLANYPTATFYHGQIVNCLNGITGSYGTMNLRNLLFANVQTNFNNISVEGINAQNTTFSGSSYLVQGVNEYTKPTLTNCILANVTNLTNSGVYYGFSGAYNGFYNSPVFGTSQATNNFYPFQSVGAGNYYLTNGCAFTNAGTTSIDPTLLASLQQKTTYPPLLLTNQTVSTNTTLNPQAQRDTNAALSLGYHYDPIDYIADLYAITNATLTVTNGTAIASYNETGIQLQNGSAIVSVGSPLYPNWFVRYSSVQEETNLLGGTNAANGLTVNAYDNGVVWPTGQYLFSKFACLAGGGFFFNDSGTNAYSSLLIQDCELWNGTNDFNGNTNTAITLQNNLFYRSDVYALGYVFTSLSLSNNLIFGTTVFFYNGATTNTWQAFNNAFDSCGVWYDPPFTTIGKLTNGYNAYLNCYGFYGNIGELWPTNASDFVTNATMAYQTGPLGNFYQPTNSPLIHMGSTNANLLGLFYYTVTTNETIEATNTVSMGYHYVATDAYGNPLDTYTNGIPDYLFDANGSLGVWELQYFGNIGMDVNSDYDGDGNTLLYDYENGPDPNVIGFSLQFTNSYFNTNIANGAVTILSGVPSYEAILINDTNLADAVWQSYTSTNVVVTLPSTNGTYNVSVGLRGLPTNAVQTWLETQLTLNTVAPMLTVTNPTSGTVSVPMIQLQGYVNESLSKLTFDVSNAVGVVTNQQGYWQPAFYDTNLLSFTTNSFQCYDIPLTNGVNAITLHATDLEDNSTTTNFSYTLSYAGITNPPMLSLIWPMNNTAIGGTNFTLQAQVSDATAIVTATINSNMVQGIVERSGLVWLQNLPLNSGTNTVTVTATSAAGSMNTTNINVVKSAMSLTIDPLSSDQQNQASATVTGTIGNTNDVVVVNGVSATVNDDGTWEADGVPVSPTGTAMISAAAGADTNDLAVAQTLDQPQPALATISSYENVYRSTSTEVSYYYFQSCAYPTTFDDDTINWVSGNGSDYTYGSSWDGECGDGLSFNSETTDLSTYTNNLPVIWEYANTSDNVDGQATTITRQTSVTIAPSGQSPVGGSALYLVEASALEFSDPYLISDPYADYGYTGDVPLPPEWLQIRGKTLVNTGITNGDGSVMGLALVSAPAGAAVDVTPTITQFYTNHAASFNMLVTNVSLQIIDGNTGTNLTAQTNTVIVGQQMNWYCQLSLTNQYMTNFIFTNFSWTIPGFAISNYVVASDSSSAVVVTNFPLNSSNVVFYWVDGATNRTIQCSATIGGKTVTGQATFDVIQPLPQFSIQVVGTIAVDTNYHTSTFNSLNGDIVDEGVVGGGGTWLHFGIDSSWANVGMAFIFTNAPVLPLSVTYGRYFIVQIVNDGDIKKNMFSGTNLIGLEESPYGLDTDYPYQESGDFWHLGGYSYRTNDMWYDAPASKLDGTTWLSRTNSFTTYLMFQSATPDYTNTIPVPMYSATWSWAGIAETNGTLNSFFLFSSSLPSPIVSQTLNYPTWTTNVVNFQYQTNNTPFNEN
jgi:hypothetical protein